MSDRFNAFLDSFSSWGLDEDDRAVLQALADYTTNTLRVYVPASNPVEMTIIHAFVSREEFMHGEWDAAIVHSCARLRIAAIELFFDLLRSPTHNPAERLKRIRKIWQIAQTIDHAIEPFQEAVDKIQILSVIAGEEPFFDNIQEKFESEFGPDAVEEYYDGQEVELSDVLEERVEEQRAIARGEKTAALDSRSNLYVNPLYTFALATITSEGVDIENPDDDADLQFGQLSQHRPIAETVARVTLDIPFPIAPLGPDAIESELQVNGLTVDSMPLEDLRSQEGLAARYKVSKEDYERYLLTHLSRTENPDLRERLGPTVEQYDPTWLDAVFVSTLKAIDDLQESGELPSDRATLRRTLSKEVHGVDISDPNVDTMVDRPTHLQSIPEEASLTDIDNDYISEEGDPLPKIILEAFEQHGSFGAVIFRPTKGENNHEMNFHAVIDDAVADHPDVPDDIASYEELWNHYLFGKEAINTLWEQRSEYRDTLINDYINAYDSKEELTAALENVESQFRRRPSTSPTIETVPDRGRGSYAKTSRSGGREDTEGVLDWEWGLNQADDHFGDEEAIRATLASWQTWDLREAARLLDIDHSSIDDINRMSSFTCPLCDLVGNPCGDDACAFESVAESFHQQSPAFIEELLKIEARDAAHQ
jgi:hypothetical protein